ncbi:hypothetical protein [Desulfonema magnum]|uniref:Lipoprotein n=1 Tax=Desulfonema magnum TaxID=45655 RepID=A0A975BR07_9BACT|nr:hypothetical protein [Desulfonema magnum]QTA89619.1 Uncharacterized protein dnm_056750 [Desulfonema magnum]
MVRHFIQMILLTFITAILLSGCTQSLQKEIKEIKGRLNRLERNLTEINEASRNEMDMLKGEVNPIRMKAFLADTISPVDSIREGSLTQIIEEKKVLDHTDHESILRFYLNQLEYLIAKNNKNGVRNATLILKLLELEPATWKGYSPYIYKIYNSSVLSSPLKWQETLLYYFDMLDKMPNDDLKMAAYLTGAVCSADTVRKRASQGILNDAGKHRSVLAWADHESILKFYLEHFKNTDPRNTEGVNNAILIIKQMDTSLLRKYEKQLNAIYINFTNNKKWEKISDIFFDNIIDKMADNNSNM